MHLWNIAVAECSYGGDYTDDDDTESDDEGKQDDNDNEFN